MMREWSSCGTGPGLERSTAALIDEDFAAQRCFELNQYCAYFLSPSQFLTIASWVGALRARTYRQISPHGPVQVDLDGRDAHYWHLLILDRERQSLAGSLRMCLSRWHEPWMDGSRSYLEHCYPGLDGLFRRQGLAYAEIGRTLVASPYQRTSPVLLMLLRAMVSIPLATGHSALLGMVSYNHLQHSDALHRRFLANLLQPPFVADCPVPPPRHPMPSLPAGRGQAGEAPPAQTLGELERRLEEEFQEPFRAPLLLKKYMIFGNAQVAGLSLARDFNQICEILMRCDLTGLLPKQRSELVVEDLRAVW
jgi:hypothetical protein